MLLIDLFQITSLNHSLGEERNSGSLLQALIRSNTELLMPVSMLEFVTAPHSVVDIFGSPLLNIVTLNGCCCKILHNNSEFPTWIYTTVLERQRVSRIFYTRVFIGMFDCYFSVAGNGVHTCIH